MAAAGPVELRVTLEVHQSAHLGEGPLWDARSNRLLWLDVLGAKVFRYDPVAKINVATDLSKHTQHVTTVVPIQGTVSSVVVGTTEGIAALDLEQGEGSLRAHGANGSHHGEFVRMNDGKCDPQGRLWIGSMARRGPDGADIINGGGALYVYQGWNSGPTKILEDVSISNGIVWSLDGKTMHYIDSLTFRVDSFDFDGEAAEPKGFATNRRRAIKVSDSFPPVPDGSALDSEGMLWVACFGAGEVRRYNPGTGELVAVARMPPEAGVETTACAFGGEMLDELYVTTAHEFWGADKLAKHPIAGGLFKVSREELQKVGGVRGVPATHFKL